jgi:hypothetical protein
MSQNGKSNRFDLDRQISQLMEFVFLPENEVKQLCEKVSIY